MNGAWDAAVKQIEASANGKGTTRYFSLRHTEIDELPEELLALTELETLECPRGLSVLPEWLGQLKNLRALDFWNSTLPEQLVDLPALTTVRVRQSPARTLPEWIGGLSRLTHLVLVNGRLESLPESIGELGRLRSLVLSGNSLTSLPEGLRKLSGLKNLDLLQNEFERWPEPIEGLTGLESLSIAFLEVPEAQVMSRTRATVHFSPEPEYGDESFPETSRDLNFLARRSVDGQMLINLLSRLSPLEQLTDLYLTVA